MKKENVFKEKLFQHTLPVREGLWEAIEAQLPPKREQRIFPVFWFTLFGATLLGGALMLGVFNQEIKTPAHPSPLSQEELTANTQNSVPQNTIDETNTSVSSTTTPTSPSPGTAASDTEKNTIETERLHPKKTNSSKKSYSSKNTDISITPGISSTDLSNSSTAPASQTTLLNNTTSQTESDILAATVSRENYSTLSLLPGQETFLPTEEREMTSIHFLKPDPNCYKFSGIGNKLVFSVDVMAGPGFSPRSFELNNSSESPIYADARKATEKTQYGWSAGARFNLQHRSGLTGRIGINYTQVGDVFDYTDSLATQSTTRIDSFFAADGTFLYTETSQVLILGTLIKKIHNTYRYLDLPLIIGYELPMGRSTILVNAGPVFNLKTSYEGQILDPNLHPRSITEGDPGAIHVYKTNIGLSLYLGAGYLFPISDQFSGLIEPSFTYRLKPVTLDSYPLKERRHYGALNLGIRYHFRAS